MTLLARKITRGRWAEKTYLPPQSIRADAVTDLKTSSDALSLWQCSSEEEDVDQVFLALTTGPEVKNLDTMYVVMIPKDEFGNAGFQTEANEGKTGVGDLKSRHIDLVRLDLEALGQFAKIISVRLKHDQVAFRTEKQIKSLIKNAINSGRLDPNALSKELQQKL